MCREPVPVPPRSRLESLPVELVQMIFLRCLEFNLPRASIHIAKALSDPVLYIWLVRLAFSSANSGTRDDFFTPDYIPPPLDFFALSQQQRWELQGIILECRWCTLSLMRRCQRDYLRRVIARNCPHLILSTEDRHALMNLEFPHEDVDGSLLDSPKGMQGAADLLIHAKVAETNKDCWVEVFFNSGTLKITKHRYLLFGDELAKLPSCFFTRMPDKLLCPPWTESKLEFLSLLSGDAYIDENSSYTRSKRVLRQVIRDRDFATFERLLGFPVVIRNCYQNGNLWPVLPSHFRLALKCADERNDPFVNLLVDRRWDDIPDSKLDLKDDLLRKVGRDSMSMN